MICGESRAHQISSRKIGFVPSSCIARVVALVSLLISLAACPAEIGTEQWCKEMKEKPKGEWTANQAADFARHCLL